MRFMALSLLMTIGVAIPTFSNPTSLRPIALDIDSTSVESGAKILLAGKKVSSDSANSIELEKKSADLEKSSSEIEKSNSEPDKEKHGLRSFSGNVSWYGIPFHGHLTASGEIFNMNKLSAAHLTLPLPSKALVEDPRTGNAVIVKVNDRGPYVKTRVMDLSREAARELGTLPRGVAYVDITVLELPHRQRRTQE